MTERWEVTVPTSIRGYVRGGKGGYGGWSSPLHRLVARTRASDITACGLGVGARLTSIKECGRSGRPSPAEATKYGLCVKCWSDEDDHAHARGESVSMAGLSKTQRAAYTVACPACGAKVGLPCRDNDKLRIAWSRYVPHHERYVEARKHGQTGRKGDPQYRAR